ncbi:DUF2161 family putative PD-(D/E)XK-type phosphodiesterase [Belnapia arida]|uniref:DUF2161 family putative PD-(D/E)XK-type phosphodiesterase n=1 Tax=Belnapia arida TaxID=2804533 RepID=UPI0038B3BE4E
MVEALAELTAYRPRLNRKRRSLLLRERSRRGYPTQGGTSRTPVMTAYRQQALACAAAPHEGTRQPRDLKVIARDAGRILLRDVYGWFERAGRGVYCLPPPAGTSFCGSGPQNDEPLGDPHTCGGRWTLCIIETPKPLRVGTVG